MITVPECHRRTDRRHRPTVRGVARGGGHGWMSPRHGLKKILAPELQTDDCFATSVIRQTLLKPKKDVQFQRWFFENFLGTMPQTPILGRGYGAPPQTPPPRRSDASRLRTSLGTFGPSIFVSPSLQKSWVRACLLQLNRHVNRHFQRLKRFIYRPTSCTIHLTDTVPINICRPYS